ncbi:pyridoxamine 5'-phosphate oxidase family protein [Thermodesulfobacteriota bacterium]
MRKKEREIKDPAVISEIIRSCQACRLGLAKDNEPYIVPVSFGYDGKALYIHTGVEGKKIDCFLANERVCVEFEKDVKILSHEEKACNWSVSFQSVIGQGVIQELLEEDDKLQGLDWVMKQYSDQKWEFDAKILKITRVWKITFESLTGKQSKDKVVAGRND